MRAYSIREKGKGGEIQQKRDREKERQRETERDREKKIDFFWQDLKRN